MLGQADLFVANGLFLEEPTLRLAEANLPAGSATVTLADETISRDEWAFDFSFPAEQGVPNPHLWLDVRHAMTYVELIRDALAEVDPAGGVYIDNASRYLSQLEQLDAAIGQAIGTIPVENRKLVTLHDSWPYYGRSGKRMLLATLDPQVAAVQGVSLRRSELLLDLLAAAVIVASGACWGCC